MEKSATKSIIQDIITGKKYFTVQAVKKGLNKAGKNYIPTTVNQYLYNFKEEGWLFDAGRGWYSTISRPSSVGMESVQKLISAIEKRFPLLEFSVWSTQQLRSFAHHIMTQFTTFIYTDPDSMSAVAEHLKDLGYRVYLNPKEREVEKYFEPSPKTVVVRQSVSEEPAQKSIATVEKIMVDLFLEKERLHLMDGTEYERIFRNLVLSQRINMARLLRYAERRKVKKVLMDEILSREKDIIAI